MSALFSRPSLTCSLTLFDVRTLHDDVENVNIRRVFAILGDNREKEKVSMVKKMGVRTLSGTDDLVGMSCLGKGGPRSSDNPQQSSCSVRSWDQLCLPKSSEEDSPYGQGMAGTGDDAMPLASANGPETIAPAESRAFSVPQDSARQDPLPLTPKRPEPTSSRGESSLSSSLETSPSSSADGTSMEKSAHPVSPRFYSTHSLTDTRIPDHHQPT